MVMNDQNIAGALAEKIVEYLNARRDRKEEDFLKSKAKKNKQGKVTNGAIIERVITHLEKTRSTKEFKESLNVLKKSKKTKGQSSLDFQRQKLNASLSLVGDEILDVVLIDLKKEYSDFVSKNAKAHEPIEWLNQLSPKAVDINFATHVGKLTHSSSKSTSILDTTIDKDDRYLATNRLNLAAIDTASSNAASLPIADVLRLSVGDVSLLDLLKRGDNSIFGKFTTDQALIDVWCENFKQAFDSSNKKSYFLSKQVYFPSSGTEYHLLLPLVSSSLAHQIHLEHKKRWEEPLISAFEQQKKHKYIEIPIVRYPNKAVLHVTASNHSNASSLNGIRGGSMTLMAALPPQWNTQLPSYVDKDTIFSTRLAFELREEMQELSSYLLLLKNKELSVSEPKRNAAILSKLQTIASQLFNHVESVNDAESSDGWTEDSKLDIEYQLLFEPWRDDDAAKACKINNDWLVKLSQEFGRWLNRQLNKNKRLKLTPIQAELWAECFLIDLKAFIAMKEVVL